MTDYSRYKRISPWSINANGRSYSIDPWSFQSVNITILDLRLKTHGPNKWGLDADEVAQITGRAKFPDFGFVGQESYPNQVLRMGEYLIYPIDDKSIEREFQEGLLHYKSALGDFRDEFDQLSPIEIDEKFGDPYNYGVCRITAHAYGDGFLRVFVGRDFFDKLSSAILRVGVSEITIKCRFWNAYSDRKLYPHYEYGNEGQLYNRLFLHKETQNSIHDYISHGIVDDIDVDYSYDNILTNSGYNYQRKKIKSLAENIAMLQMNSNTTNKLLLRIDVLVILIVILLIMLFLAFVIWR
jgi:hypothetical protein